MSTFWYQQMQPIQSYIKLNTTEDQRSNPVEMEWGKKLEKS